MNVIDKMLETKIERHDMCGNRMIDRCDTIDLMKASAWVFYVHGANLGRVTPFKADGHHIKQLRNEFESIWNMHTMEVQDVDYKGFGYVNFEK